MFPRPIDIIREMPLSGNQEKFIAASRHTLQRILDGEDDHLILIVGPCSIHDEESTYEYAEKLGKLAKVVSDHFFIVMRCYLEKPRTKNGWKGLINDPDLTGLHDIERGIRMARKVLLHLCDLKVPAGSELLELSTANYYSDLLSWGCIGARTSASQPHRQHASSFSIPIGFKNTTEGNIEIALNGILAASVPHTFLYTNMEGNIDQMETEGNPYCHLVLRGGIQGPNYDSASINKAINKCEQLQIKKKLLIDCSHGNSEKIEERQISVFESVLQQYLEGNHQILGMMLESHLYGGNQTLSFPLRYGVSVTDPCIDWNKTRELILRASEKLDSLKCFNI